MVHLENILSDEKCEAAVEEGSWKTPSSRADVWASDYGFRLELKESGLENIPEAVVNKKYTIALDFCW